MVTVNGICCLGERSYKFYNVWPEDSWCVGAREHAILIQHCSLVPKSTITQQAACDSCFVPAYSSDLAHSNASVLNSEISSWWSSNEWMNEVAVTVVGLRYMSPNAAAAAAGSLSGPQYVLLGMYCYQLSSSVVKNLSLVQPWAGLGSI